MYERFMSMGPEVKQINWKQAGGALYRWPQVIRRCPIHARYAQVSTDMTIQLWS